MCSSDLLYKKLGIKNAVAVIGGSMGGMRNIIDKNGSIEPEAIYYTQAIDRLTSRIFLITFYFQ